MQHDQPVMEGGSDAVAGEVANHVVAEPVCVRLDDAADHRQRTARLDGFDRPHRRFVGPLDEQAVLLGDVAGQKGRVGVTVHTVDVRGDIDVDDVAVFDHRRVGDAVADDFVQRRAARLGITLVAQRRWIGAVVDHVVVSDAVQRIGRHTGRDGLARLRECIGSDLPGNPHLLDHLGRLHPWLGALPRRRLADVFRAWDRLGHRQRRRDHAGRQCRTNRHGVRVSVSGGVRHGHDGARVTGAGL